MLRNVKLGKIFAVISLSALVWIWADLASDEEFPVYSATLNIVPSQPDLWVSFEKGASVSIKEIVLKGPAARIAELNRRLKQGERLEFDFDAAQADMSAPGPYSLRLQDFLQRDKQIKRMGLKVESCKPERVPIVVQELMSTTVDVECVDERGNQMTANIDPPSVKILLPEGWVGRVAYVQLNANEKKEARLSAVYKKPYVRLANDQTVLADKNVAVTIPSEEFLQEQAIETPSLGFALSKNLLGKYEVDVEGFLGHLAGFKIRATPEAKRLYENQTFQLILEIRDGDAASTEYQSRPLKYNFPDECLSKGEIEPAQPAPVARFKLIALPSREEEPVEGPSE